MALDSFLAFSEDILGRKTCLKIEKYLLKLFEGEGKQGSGNREISDCVLVFPDKENWDFSVTHQKCQQ